MRVAVNICRFIVAATFIISGFVKAVDPMGTQYKIEEYLRAWGLADMIPDIVALTASVVLSAAEFTMGILLAFAVRRRLVTRLLLIVMLVLTPLTLWIALSNPVTDCGCFGDAIVLTNWQSFAKNVVLLACAIVLCRQPLLMVRFLSRDTQWIVINYTVVFILIISGYSLYTLPQIDFRPFHVGANIREGMAIPDNAEQPVFQTTFIMEKDGKQKEFSIDNYPDSTWTFVDSKTRLVSSGYVPPISDFSVTLSGNDEDITRDIVDYEGCLFLLVAPHVEKADDSQFDDINELYDYSLEQGMPFYCLTASSDNAISRWVDFTGAEYPFATVDETTLKTMIRSNPGLMLLCNGTVVGKWGHNNLPSAQELGSPVNTAQLLGQAKPSKAATAAKMVALFLLPLVLLTVADRLWAWSAKVRAKENDLKNTYKLFKKGKNMRKKIVAGNWKMNMNLQDGIALAKELSQTLAAEKPNCGVVICTPFIHLASIASFLDQNVIGLGAENCAAKAKGAYTGEVSAEMVKSTGAQYVILGHSERREYYNETPEILKEKVQLALANGLKIIFCIGESLQQREAGKQNEVVKAELEGSVFNLSAEEFKNIIIAYEPIWAIGTGKTATADQAEEIHSYIRGVIAAKYGDNIAQETSILYGGSCKASNAPELFAKPDIDGGLIGGASLKCADFKGIIDAWK